MITAPNELVAHLQEHPQTARELVAALSDDILEATDQIMDILDRSYLSTHSLLELMDWKAAYRDYIAQPDIAAGTDWFLPLSDEFDWDSTTGSIRKVVDTDDLASDFRHRLVIEFMMQIEESGKAKEDSPYMDIFGSKVLEALDAMDDEDAEIDENALIASAAPLIAAWMRDTIQSNGEQVVMNAALKLLATESA